MKLVFASNNPHKIREIRAMLGPAFVVRSLNDIGCTQDIPEPHPSFKENALAKARYVAQIYGMDCFADDSGLEVNALNGLPGVRSARFAGPGKNMQANIRKLLHALEGESNRSARFRAVIALILQGREYVFEGRVEGRIIREEKGEGGFGYDPVFVPLGSRLSFAQMPESRKNSMSHRARAVEKMRRFLESLPQRK